MCRVCQKGIIRICCICSIVEQQRQPKAFKEDFDEEIDAEEQERKSLQAKMPVWVKILLLIGVIVFITVIAMGLIV